MDEVHRIVNIGTRTPLKFFFDQKISTANASLKKQLHVTEINTKYTKDFIPLKIATNTLLHMVRFVQSILFLISLDFYAMRKI